jgi:thiosulfate dehydrogenase (quinone) large subunit
MSSQRNATLRWGVRAIVVLSGAWTIVHLILTVAGVTANDYWDVALLILFLLTLILAFIQFSQERAALTDVSSTELFPEPAISKFFLGSNGSSEMWFLAR